uniref:Uncharacterized protein n=1 Tax=Tanacetum cinerariifolium TaxID=118510 RepID=A0A6L2KJZ7_TANCI|nr:hypothetical protein [Tanacetum cinerariifolium]
MAETQVVKYAFQCGTMTVESIKFQSNNFVRSLSYLQSVPAYREICKFLMDSPLAKAFTKTPTMLYQNYLRKLWCTVVVEEPNPPEDDSEVRPLKEFKIKFIVKNDKKSLTLDFKIFVESTDKSDLDSDLSIRLRFGGKKSDFKQDSWFVRRYVLLKLFLVAFCLCCSSLRFSGRKKILRLATKDHAVCQDPAFCYKRSCVLSRSYVLLQKILRFVKILVLLQKILRSVKILRFATKDPAFCQDPGFATKDPAFCQDLAFCQDPAFCYKRSCVLSKTVVCLSCGLSKPTVCLSLRFV